MADDIFERIKRLDKLILSKKTELALEICNEALDCDIPLSEQCSVYRSKSHIMNLKKDYNEGFNCRNKIILTYPSLVEVQDYYFSGLFLIRLQEYKRALSYLNEGIILSCDKQESYYFSALHFLKAFSFMHLKEYGATISALEFVGAEQRMWIDRPAKPYTKEELLQRISKEQWYNSRGVTGFQW